MNKLFLKILFCLMIIPPAFGNVFAYKSNLSVISTKLPELKNVDCKFTQEKIIPSSNITLKSGGKFKFDKEKGVTFYTEYPIKQTTSYTQKEYKQINSIIKAISNKQYSKLEKEFDFYFNKTSSWELGLKPKEDCKAANYLESIEITGNIDISKIVITTKDKTKTTIRFSK